ncbi:response regulator [Candidatus Chlorohelix sp.]|uniref:response regulator n=1 Tax=Candidatus Chlorohelix sp. TaxID=3139201 RepID=UPI00305E6AA4
MTLERIRILIIGHDRDEIIQAFSDTSLFKNIRFELVIASDLTSAILLLNSNNSDIAILSNPSQSSEELKAGIKKLHQSNSNLPVIVILDNAEETLVESVLEGGAKDYLVRGQIDSNILRRVFGAFWHMDGTNRETLSATRETKEFERLSTPPGTKVTAQAFGVPALTESATTTFSTLIQDYSRILHEAVESQIFKVNYTISENLRVIADQLGFLKAGPRDVVLLHQQALKAAVASRTLEQTNIYAEEGRYLLLELMGHLVSYYRNYYLYETRNQSLVNGREPGVK